MNTIIQLSKIPTLTVQDIIHSKWSIFGFAFALVPGFMDALSSVDDIGRYLSYFLSFVLGLLSVVKIILKMMDKERVRKVRLDTLKMKLEDGTITLKDFEEALKEKD